MSSRERGPSVRRTQRESNIFRYAAKDLSTAKAVVLTPEPGSTTAGRWSDETAATISLIDPLVPTDGVVLDFGAGPGRLSKAILSTHQDALVVAVDSSSEMLGLFKRYVGKRVVPRVRLVHFVDVRRLQQDLPKKCVDLAVAVYVLQHVSASLLPGVLTSIRDSLRPGGKFFVINSYKRVVPKISQEERKAKSRGEKDRAVHLIANRVDNGPTYWTDDSIDVEAELRKVFGRPRYVSLRRNGFVKSIWSKHFCAVYSRRDSELPSPSAQR